MAWQLIYTSALRTLVPGQSGYGTVARSADLREALVQRLEQFSYYQHSAAAPSQTTPPSPVVCAYRALDFRGSRYHVLTRIQDAGLDFTNRTNHLAHHLVFEPAELASLPPPAVILARWNGWRRRWEESPRFLEDADWGDLRTMPRSVPLPAAGWQRVTGDAGSAAALVLRPLALGCNLLCPAGEETTLLGLFAESLQLLDPNGWQPVKLWGHPFTTFLQAEDNPADFLWRGCVEGTPGALMIQRTSDGSLVPLCSIAAPSSHLARLAREGKPKRMPPASQPQPPSVSAPANSTRPLRQDNRPDEKRTTSTLAAGVEDSRVTGRAVVLDCTSPRFWVPALILLLAVAVLLAAFVWPGFLKPQPGVPPPPAKIQLPEANLSLEPPGALLPDDTPPAAGHPRDRFQPSPHDVALFAPPPAALADLRRQLDDTRTWLVVLEGESPFAVPRNAELDRLLRTHLMEDKPLTQIAQGRGVEGRIELSGEPATTMELESNATRPKQLTARLSGSPRLVLECDDWFAATRSATTADAPVRLRSTIPPAAGALTLLLRPAPGSPMERPFRLVILTGKPLPQAAPVMLTKSLLRPGGTGLDALAPELLECIQAIQLGNPRLHWQLRASTATTATGDLLDQLEPVLVCEPGRELDFAAMSQRLESKLTQARRTRDHASAEAEKLRRQIEDDRPLGNLLLGHTNELASLSSFAKATKRNPDCPTYLLYLKELLSPLDTRLAQRLPSAEGPPDDARERLFALGDALARHPQLKKGLNSLPPRYFMDRWDVLARVPDLALMDANVEKTRRMIGDCERAAALIPRELAAVPRVSLFLVSTGRQRYEIIRFADIAAKPVP